MQALEMAIARRQTELPAHVVVDGLSEMVRRRARKYDEIYSEPEEWFWRRFED
jgi:hypothetical protein